MRFEFINILFTDGITFMCHFIVLLHILIFDIHNNTMQNLLVSFIRFSVPQFYSLVLCRNVNIHIHIHPPDVD